MRDCKVPSIQEGAKILSESLATRLKEAQENQGIAEELFCVPQMDIGQKKTSLHKASMASS